MNLIEAFREELFKDFENNSNAIYLGEDVRNAHRGIAIGLHSRFGSQRVIDMPISESAFTGLGLGLAIGGKNVFVEFNFAGLLYLGLDQIFNQAHKFNEMLNSDIDLKITYILPTGTRGGLAGHHSDNPYALLTHLGINSYMPSNSLDCKYIFREIKAKSKPAAIFLPVSSFFNEYGCDVKLNSSKSWGFYKIKNGKNLNIICTGTTITNLMQALEEMNFLSPNIYIFTDLNFSQETINAIKDIENKPTIFMDDSFEKCGIASEIRQYLPNNIKNQNLCRESLNVPFAEYLENDIIVSKKRIKKLLLGVTSEKI